MDERDPETTKQEIEMKVKSVDLELVIQIMEYIGVEFQEHLSKASMDESLGDFLDLMESYGYWDSLKGCVKDVPAFCECLKVTY